MGCDIHAVLEQKDPTSGRWIGLTDYRGIHQLSYRATWEMRDPAKDPRTQDIYIWPVILDRDYKLFAQLAGVRGDGPAPRGIPPDASELAMLSIASWGTDGHSHSWGLIEEIGPLFFARRYPDKMLDPDRYYWMNAMFNLVGDPDLDKYRLVYWFDN